MEIRTPTAMVVQVAVPEAEMVPATALVMDRKGPGFGGDGNSHGVLKGRAVVNLPQLPKDTKEEGKVVVEITVNSEGKVIEAN